MPQSLAQIYVHIVFSTRLRQRFLQPATLKRDLHRYLAGTCKRQACPAIEVGGVEDHVHILCSLSKTMCIADLVRELKRESSKWVKEKSRDLRGFQWQQGYSAFSISPSHVPALREYILNQEEHHQIVPFEDELRRLLKKYGVEFDEQYLWD